MMSNMNRSLSMILAIVFIAITCVIVTTIPEMLRVSRAEEQKKQKISTATTTKTKATIAGISCPDQELVLRIEDETQPKPYEWVSWYRETRPFTATVEFGDIVPLGDNRSGEGLVFVVRHSSGEGGTSTATFNIGLSEDDPLPTGTLSFREGTERGLPIENNGNSSVTIADIVREDGTKVPLKIILRAKEQESSQE